MTLKDTILSYISGLPGGATDTDIEKALGVKSHAQVDRQCNQLAREGLIDRREIAPLRFRNFYTGLPRGKGPDSTRKVIPDKPWFWEGNVQAKVLRYLVENGWDVTRVADPASKETGKDVTAQKDGREIWISVKGRPRGPERTNAATQSRAWFHAAFFELASWRGQNSEAELMLALPAYGMYRSLASRVSWLAETIRYSILWVSDDGDVSLDA